jgi:hypothetical protein
MVSVLIDFPGRKKRPLVRCKKCGHLWQVQKRAWIKRRGALPRRCPRKGCESTDLEVVS